MKMTAAYLLRVLLVAVLGVGLVACNTVRGIGRDLEAGGEAIQKATK
jgi:predicted small secreted protein